MIFSPHVDLFYEKRSEALFIYKIFSAMDRSQFGTSIRVFCIDSVGKYLSRALHKVLVAQGTLAQFCCPDAHVQNGVAKRKHCHLLETSQALMLASSTPPPTFRLRLSLLPLIWNSAFLGSSGWHSFRAPLWQDADYSSLRLFACVMCLLWIASALSWMHSLLSASSLGTVLSIRVMLLGFGCSSEEDFSECCLYWDSSFLS